MFLQEQVRQEILQRILNRFTLIVQNETIDLDYLLDVAQQEHYLVTAASQHLSIPAELLSSLQQLISILQSAEEAPVHVPDLVTTTTTSGRPRLEIAADHLNSLLSTALPLERLAKLCGISRRTLNRRMKEHGLSVRGCYSNISDIELDCVVRSIKSRMPHAGYRLVKGELLARGYRVQWHRVKDTMHRVDGAGILSRMIQLRFVTRRSYCVPAPLSLVHVDTNHKLIRSVYLSLSYTF